jgi:hypothetical protein
MTSIGARFLSHALAVENGKYAAVDLMELLPNAQIASELVIKRHVIFHFVKLGVT